MAKVLIVGSKHLSYPNSPRHSRHQTIFYKPFPCSKYNLGKLWNPLGRLIIPRMFSGQEHQVIHAFNKIIYTNKPWFLTTEDHTGLFLKSTNKLEDVVHSVLRNRLALNNCQKIIGISDYAKLRLMKLTSNWDIKDQVQQKIAVIHPNFLLKTETPKTYNQLQSNIQCVFIGKHLARKGGIVALRLAKKAEQLKLPINIHIVSGLKYGLPNVPTDFPDQSKYEQDMKLLNLSNVVLHNTIPNAKVLELLAQSHFQLMATLHDTYGYSVIEGFTVATPAITTNVCALPEFVRHGETGYVLELPLNELRHWKNWLHGEQTATPEYWSILNNTYDDLAEKALQQIIEFLDRYDKKDHYELLSAGALAQAQNMNNSKIQNDILDNLYAVAAGETKKL